MTQHEFTEFVTKIGYALKSIYILLHLTTFTQFFASLMKKHTENV